MSQERTEELCEPRSNITLAVGDEDRRSESPPSEAAGEELRHRPDAQVRHGPAAVKRDADPKTLSPKKVQAKERLPALEDDADVGVEKEQTVVRDGKPDLLFLGVLLGSVASTAPKGHWEEYRIYRTNGGKHVFAKVRRSVYVEETDAYQAEVFDPAPASMPSQILRSAREMARQKTLTWTDAAVAFFGYDPLAKALYRKLNVRFEEQIT